MKYREDIDPDRTWVWSDTHFGHENIIGYCHRPPDFEQILLENVNAAVSPGDTLLHLGDLCYRGNALFRNVIAPKIAPGARKLLIAGNHDRQRYSFYKRCGWKLISPFCIRYGRWPTPYRIEFDHYPASEYPHGTTWRLHGHIHNNGYFDGRRGGDWSYVPFLRNHVNLSVEQTKYKPVHLRLLLDAILYGEMPAGEAGADGDAPTASEIGKESHHA